MAQNILCQQEVAFAAGEEDQPLYQRRQGNEAQQGIAALLQIYSNVKLLVVQVGEWMAGVDDLGGENGQNRGFEQPFDKAVLFAFQLSDLLMLDPFFAQPAHHGGIGLVAGLIQRAHGFEDLFQLLLGRHTSFVVVV